MFAKVLVDLKVKSLDRLFDYIIPKDEIESLKIGMRVIVPFGTQTRLGYVIEISDESLLANKELIEVLDIIPTINDEMFEYIEYLKSINDSLSIDLVETIIPSELFLKYEQELTIIDHEKISEEILQLFNEKNKITYSNSWFKKHKTLLNKEIRNGFIKVESIVEQKGKNKYKEAVVYLSDNNYKNINKYFDLIEFIKESNSLSKTEISKEGFSISSINTLIKNGVLGINEIKVDRTVKYKKARVIPEHKLTNEQEYAKNEIIKSLSENKIFLLKGITGSGKTEVYIQAIDEVLNNNKNILYLVPEMNLVAPLMQYLNSRFNLPVTHYNSYLSQGERYDAWNNIIKNDARIIVGTRSSIFLPIKNLGLIIMDEEHDKSYLQKDNVQYDTFEIAKIKTKHHNCPLVLGSATPKVESMYHALKGDYELLELTKRATNQKLPKVHFVDMKEELKKGNTKIFSEKLEKMIKDRLIKKEQIILLYNRKGYASFTMCRMCGHTPKCPTCDISLTYYKNDNMLKCSYCGHKENNIEICPSCSKKAIKPVGLGVDQVYEIVKNHFKEARVIKLDADSTTKKGSHERIWLDFQNHEYDILIGTQMVSKGLDFPKVTLVGVLMADLELKAPTYLATEDTYALLTQMVGRSGRSLEGDAVIQGYDLDNFAIKNVNKTYEDFYKDAIYYRKISKYQPFYNVSQVLIKNESYLKGFQDATRIKKALNSKYEVVLGPVEASLKYIKNEFRFIVTIKNKSKIDNKIFKIINENNKSSKASFLSIPDII